MHIANCAYSCNSDAVFLCFPLTVAPMMADMTTADTAMINTMLTAPAMIPPTTFPVNIKLDSVGLGTAV